MDAPSSRGTLSSLVERRSLPPTTPRESIRWAAGPNYCITIEGASVAVLEVWQAPELTREQGAQCAEQMASRLRELSRTQRGLVLDLRRATVTWGPRTQLALEQMVRPWEERGREIWVVPANEPIQAIAVKRLLERAASRHGHMATSVEVALASAGRAKR